jgi:hypothetical protein
MDDTCQHQGFGTCMDFMIKPDIILSLPCCYKLSDATLLFTADSHLEMQYIPAHAEVGRIPLHILQKKLGG